MKNLIFRYTTLIFLVFLAACSTTTTPQIPNVNGVYSGYIQGTNGNRLIAALALRNDGQVRLTAGFAVSISSGIVSFAMTGSMSGNTFSVSYSDSSGSITMNGSVNSGTITGSFVLNSSSGNVSGTIFFSYSRSLSTQSFQAENSSLTRLSQALLP